jgi:ABC-2 type transport system permease protein
MSNRTVSRALLRAALRQARTTLVRKYTSPSGLGALFISVFVLAVLWFVRDVEFADGLVAATGWIFAGFLAFGVVAAAIMGVAGELQTEREDGTLLRAKAVPHGMTGHLVAKLLVTPLDALLPVVPVVVGAALLMPGTMPTGLSSWLLLVLVFVLTVAAMMPWGAVLGAVFRSMLTFAWSMIGIYVLAAVSGLFFPATVLPTWVQWLVQATPLYWIGRAFRGVLLPEQAAAAEIGGEWRLGLTLVVLLAWAVVGMLVAPVLLRRMARRQSGSVVAAARERVMQRGY